MKSLQAYKNHIISRLRRQKNDKTNDSAENTKKGKSKPIPNASNYYSLSFQISGNDYGYFRK